MAVTYLSDYEIREWRTVADPDVNKLLQELRQTTGLDWLIAVKTRTLRRLSRKPVITESYTLYVGTTAMEYRVISLRTAHGSSIFHGDGNSKQHVINFMLGFLSGWEERGIY